MTLFVTLAVIVTFSLLGYYYAPRHTEEGWQVDRLRPRDPLSNLPVSHYDEQRLFRDIAAVYARREDEDPSDDDAPGRRRGRAEPST
ncbi:hypothetical protein [Nocardia cyriacigeorgica]|jgi:hypothetical protein|uniref:hypothetical protein n=1 Tax=Nocardia cyriacigeorgica TaxID=135487 RepID=UPI00189369AF|nr:hypothetical protein [Nocardia cyriacigeorgica]MBF6437468.1 hypothetical protein [Nocardia cyriacigeorgica]MBF6453037.1 hypothetical protein [Nocardia cyriacigeorgica]MBF6476944.1 hypothetical protein [Nocardia cyriacigeorgica]MBF6550206.1 hypothetical protein [Nocardia cyriacigeorgica]